MQIVQKQKPTKKREFYRKITLEIVGTDKAAFFERKADMEDFKRVVHDLGFKPTQRKDNGWFVWVKKV